MDLDELTGSHHGDPRRAVSGAVKSLRAVSQLELVLEDTPHLNIIALKPLKFNKMYVEKKVCRHLSHLLYGQ